MKSSLTQYSSPWPGTAWRRGLTLIEVMAGLLILGTLLVTLVEARGRYLHQWRWPAGDRTQLRRPTRC